MKVGDFNFLFPILPFINKYLCTIFTFKGSEATEKVTKLLNDVFDIFNSRRAATSITKSNWVILDETERINDGNDGNVPPTTFMSDTTIQGWRLSVHSLISLTDEMLDDTVDDTVYDKPFTQILSSKFNQDPVEVRSLITLVNMY